MQKVVGGWGRERHAVRCRARAPPALLRRGHPVRCRAGAPSALLRSGHCTRVARSVPVADHCWPRIAMCEEIISSMKTALFHTTKDQMQVRQRPRPYANRVPVAVKATGNENRSQRFQKLCTLRSSKNHSAEGQNLIVRSKCSFAIGLL